MRNQLRIVAALAAVLLGTGCPSGGTKDTNTGKDAPSGLTAEQQKNYERYQQIRKSIKEALDARSFARALKLVDRALVLAGQIYSPDYPLTAETLALRGDVIRASGRFKQAAEAYAAELKAWKRVLDAGENVVVAGCHHKIGASYFMAGDLANAARALGLAATMKRNTLTKSDGRLGKHYVHKSGKPRGASLAQTLQMLGLVQWKLKKYDDAAKSLAEAVALNRKHLRPTHLSLLRSLLTLAQLYEITKKYADAEKLYHELVGRLGKQPSPNKTLMGQALKNLADVNRRMGKLDAAEKNYKQARALVEKATRFAKRVTYLALIDGGLAIVYVKSGKPKQAEKLFRQAIANYEKAPGNNAVGLVMCHIQLGKIFRAAGKNKQAMEEIRKALDIARKKMGPTTYGYARALAEYGATYQAQGVKAQAARLLRNAFDIVHRLYGGTHPRTTRIRTKLEKLYKALRWNKKLKELPK